MVTRKKYLEHFVILLAAASTQVHASCRTALAAAKSCQAKVQDTKDSTNERDSAIGAVARPNSIREGGQTLADATDADMTDWQKVSDDCVKAQKACKPECDPEIASAVGTPNWQSELRQMEKQCLDTTKSAGKIVDDQLATLGDANAGALQTVAQSLSSGQSGDSPLTVDSTGGIAETAGREDLGNPQPYDYGDEVKVAGAKYEDVFARVHGGDGEEEYVGQQWSSPNGLTNFLDADGQVWTFDKDGNLK